jgi:ADP-ribose pyrophosphatase YjhB (NUDIX family)
MDQIICTVDVVLLTLQGESLQVALMRRGYDPHQGNLALPGGFVHADEDQDTRAAALRMLRAKTGIVAPYLEQLHTFSGRTRDPRGWSLSVVYYALVPHQVMSEEVLLLPLDQLPDLPFDHRAMIDLAEQRLRSKSQYSSLPCHLLEQPFTLPALQRVYEILLGEPLNKVSFRRKMDEMAMLEPVDGEFTVGQAHRPAQLYRLKPAFLQQLQLLVRGL